MPHATLLSQHRALVIGATGGIGAAIAMALASAGAAVSALGRNPVKLAALAHRLLTTQTGVHAPSTPSGMPLDQSRSVSSQVGPDSSQVIRSCDFLNHDDVARQSKALANPGDDFDIVVLASGEFIAGGFRQADAQAFDRAYTINVRTPYVLLRATLDGLIRRRGQVVVVSSSAALRGRASAAQYSATHAALRSLTESLRDEMNEFEVRVLAVYPGRTATDLWVREAQLSGQPYHPELLLQPEDIATSIVSALTLPRTAELTDLHIRPLKKSY